MAGRTATSMLVPGVFVEEKYDTTLAVEKYDEDKTRHPSTSGASGGTGCCGGGGGGAANSPWTGGGGGNSRVFGKTEYQTR